MSLMPTWLIGIWRVSARLCTSSTETTRAWGAAAMFMTNLEKGKARTVCGLSRRDQPLGRDNTLESGNRHAGYRVLCPGRLHLRNRQVFPPAPHGTFQACLIQFSLRQTFLARAVFHEAIGNAERQRGQ